MGKRSDFKRRKNDGYDTPPEAVAPLIRQLSGNGLSFWEPCAGAFALGTALMDAGLHCSLASDISPRAGGVVKMDAMTEILSPRLGILSADLIITNPPWTRQILHPMIDHFRKMRPTWLLFDADWMHCKQAIPYLPYCHKIVSVGRVKWIPDSPHTGKDNAAWYFFDRYPAPTEFIGRTA